MLITRPRTAAAIVKFGATGARPATAALRRDDMEQAMRVFGTATLGGEAFRLLSESRREQVRANLIKAEFLGSGFPPLETPKLRRIQAPALPANGQSSPGLFHRLAERLQEVLPHAERAEIPGASHIMHEDNAAAYDRVVLSFLARHQDAA